MQSRLETDLHAAEFHKAVIDAASFAGAVDVRQVLFCDSIWVNDTFKFGSIPL